MPARESYLQSCGDARRGRRRRFCGRLRGFCGTGGRYSADEAKLPVVSTYLCSAFNTLLEFARPTWPSRSPPTPAARWNLEAAHPKHEPPAPPTPPPPHPHLPTAPRPRARQTHRRAPTEVVSAPTPRGAHAEPHRTQRSRNALPSRQARSRLRRRRAPSPFPPIAKPAPAPGQTPRAFVRPCVRARTAAPQNPKARAPSPPLRTEGVTTHALARRQPRARTHIGVGASTSARGSDASQHLRLQRAADVTVSVTAPAWPCAMRQVPGASVPGAGGRETGDGCERRQRARAARSADAPAAPVRPCARACICNWRWRPRPRPRRRWRCGSTPRSPCVRPPQAHSMM